MADVTKRAMPDSLRARAGAAIATHRGRFAIPAFELERRDDGTLGLTCPYGEEDRDNWEALLYEAFGTCSLSAARTFLSQLKELCGQEWQPDEGWAPDMAHLNTAIAVIASTKPENEAQACIAAQMVALHFTAMKLGGVMGGHTRHPDERTASSLARVSKAYATMTRTLAELQGKSRTRHDINVTYIDARQQAFVTPGGGQYSGGQPHERDLPTQYTDTLQQRPALPSLCQDDRQSMLGASGEGQASLSGAWWGQRIWRALRRG